jgi:hypothetical protein
MQGSIEGPGLQDTSGDLYVEVGTDLWGLIRAGGQYHRRSPDFTSAITYESDGISINKNVRFTQRSIVADCKLLEHDIPHWAGVLIRDENGKMRFLLERIT